MTEEEAEVAEEADISQTSQTISCITGMSVTEPSWEDLGQKVLLTIRNSNKGLVLSFLGLFNHLGKVLFNFPYFTLLGQ